MKTTTLLSRLPSMTEDELRREMTEILTRQKLGLVWEHSAIDRDGAANQDVVLPRLNADLSHGLGDGACPNLIIEGDNFDSLRLLRATHLNKIRVIYIDPPYNTGNKDWVYNDDYVGKNDRWRHSQWLEFLYQRLTLARDLLTPDGVILVSINDENRSRLELLMDEVFPGMRIGSFVWRSRSGGNDTKGAFFSDNHEHVLVYGKSGFRFTGDEKSYSMYKYQEGERVFRLSDLTKAHDFRERPNTYYPIYDPETDTYYPCNPQRVWAYASDARVKEGQKIRGDTIETLITNRMVWFPPVQRVEVFEKTEQLLDAVQRKDVPMSGSTPLLFEGMPDIDFWVGKRIGYGRPAFKRFKEGLKNETQPISSWLTPRHEVKTLVEGLNMPVVGTTEEGSKQLKEVMGDKAFPYPKPPSLIKGLLAQATQPEDIVLDFFAGSGTLGQVTLELNAEDGGDRKFILCSSTEQTVKEPGKNICRDVCAERMRRVMSGYGTTAGLGGQFAYLNMDKLDPADADLDASTENIRQLLALRHVGGAIPLQRSHSEIDVLVRTASAAVIYIPKVTPTAIGEAAQLTQQRLLVFSDRPETVRELLDAAGKECDSRSAAQEISAGQAGMASIQSVLQEAV